ncbi:MAG: hypothetical protein A2X24_05120 [Chloroflexi bacterium GWB2_54_36]|nr:MAG: hypothetical protein A2X24_05120 [Chloroflexi bacterium GWB2_54_36]
MDFSDSNLQKKGCVINNDTISEYQLWIFYCHLPIYSHVELTSVMNNNQIFLRLILNRTNNKHRVVLEFTDQELAKEFTIGSKTRIHLAEEGKGRYEGNNIGELTIFQNGYAISVLGSDSTGQYKVAMFGKPQFIKNDDPLPSQNYLILADGKIKMLFLWEQAALFLPGNPAYLFYTYDGENHFSVVNLEEASLRQSRAVMKYINTFSKLLKFKQEQRGGRKKGSRARNTIKKYNRIMNYRNSVSFRNKTDKEFLERYPQFNQSELSRAKKWYREGKPGY